MHFGVTCHDRCNFKSVINNDIETTNNELDVIMQMFPNINPYTGKMKKVKNLRNWMIDTATVLFDDDHNDLRSLPKTVRLQILVVLSFVWSTVFTVYFLSLIHI